jgi:hypothetical protein
MHRSVHVVHSTSSLLTIRFGYQKMCKYISVKAAVPLSCIRMAGYYVKMETVIGVGCAGSHISVGMMEKFSGGWDKK